MDRDVRAASRGPSLGFACEIVGHKLACEAMLATSWIAVVRITAMACSNGMSLCQIDINGKLKSHLDFSEAVLELVCTRRDAAGKTQLSLAGSSCTM